MRLPLYLYAASSKLLSELSCNTLCKWDSHSSAVDKIVSLECEQGLEIPFLLEELLLEKGCIYFLFLLQF